MPRDPPVTMAPPLAARRAVQHADPRPRNGTPRSRPARQDMSKEEIHFGNRASFPFGSCLRDDTIPEKQTVRYLGAFFGAQDILPGSSQMRRAGWQPTKSAWFTHAWPKRCAATSSVYAAARMPEYNASIAIRFWLSLALPHSEYGAASMVRAGIPDFERTQANVGKAFINLWPGDSVSHSAVLMELGLWRIETRHKMSALRLLRDIILGDPSSQLRAIYNTYLQCCEALEWPTRSWCVRIRETLTPLDMDNLLCEWDLPLAARDIVIKLFRISEFQNYIFHFVRRTPSKSRDCA